MPCCVLGVCCKFNCGVVSRGGTCIAVVAVAVVVVVVVEVDLDSVLDSINWIRRLRFNPVSGCG